MNIPFTVTVYEEPNGANSTLPVVVARLCALGCEQEHVGMFRTPTIQAERTQHIKIAMATGNIANQSTDSS